MKKKKQFSHFDFDLCREFHSFFPFTFFGFGFAHTKSKSKCDRIPECQVPLMAHAMLSTNKYNECPTKAGISSAAAQQRHQQQPKYDENEMEQNTKYNGKQLVDDEDEDEERTTNNNKKLRLISPCRTCVFG